MPQKRFATIPVTSRQLQFCRLTFSKIRFNASWTFAALIAPKNITFTFNTSTPASGDNTIVASGREGAKTAIRVWQLIITPGANADVVTLKFTNQGTAYTAKFSVAANGASVVR